MASPSVHLAEEVQFHKIASAMKRMLIVTVLSLAALVSIVGWLYAKLFPEMTALKADITTQQQKAEYARAQVSASCVQLATLMSNPPNNNYEDATQTLDKCAVFFPQNPVFPAYKAEVMTRWFLTDKTKLIRLEYALQAANTSFTISRSLHQKPSDLAFQGQGLAYCLLAQYGPKGSRGDQIANAKRTFQEALTSSPYLAPWVQGSNDVSTACPQAVRDSFR